MTLIETLVWDEFNLNHIKKHKVNREKVEQALNNYLLILSGHNGRLLMMGETIEGRLLTIVVDKHKPKGVYVVTARDISQKEKQYLKLQEEI